MSVKLATKTVWTELSDDLRRFIRRRVADENLAEDLLQETFLRIHRNLGSLNDAERLPAWVYRIARNVIHDHFRTSRNDVALGEIDVPDEEDTTRQLRTGAQRWMAELIEQLPPAYREAVKLSEIEGLPQREVAERLGLSVPGAKSRIQRGRAMLGEVLDQCCVFHFDARGEVIDCDPKPDRPVCRDC